MDIFDLLWDDWNEEHIARHSIRSKEVEEICYGAHWPLRSEGSTYAFYG